MEVVECQHLTRPRESILGKDLFILREMPVPHHQLRQLDPAFDMVPHVRVLDVGDTMAIAAVVFGSIAAPPVAGLGEEEAGVAPP